MEKMKINIIGGLGRMGRTHAPILRRYGHQVYQTDLNTTPTPLEAARDCDVSIFSVPLKITEETIREIGPYCNQMMDFTSLKIFPIKAMTESNKTVPIIGAHPNYGEITFDESKKNLEEKVFFVCPVGEISQQAKEIIHNFNEEGAKVLTIDPFEHDRYVNFLAQLSRTEYLQAFGTLISKSGLDVRTLYDISPAPTRILIDLISRQIAKENDGLYDEMRRLNDFFDSSKPELLETLEKPFSSRALRGYFGRDFLKESQERAGKLIREYK